VSFALLSAAMAAGGLCGFVRGLRWERLEPDPEALEAATGAPLQALASVQRLGLLSGAGDLEDLAWAHMTAFEHRHPEGWRPGGGLRPRETPP